MKTLLKNQNDALAYFAGNKRPVVFLNQTPIQLMDLRTIIGGLEFICARDCFDGSHANVFVPQSRLPAGQSLAEQHNGLLRDQDVAQKLRSLGPGVLLTSYYDEQTHELASQAGFELCFPSFDMRKQIDNKISGTSIAAKAGLPCIPYVEGTVSTYRELLELTSKLGKDLVIQLPFGGGGATTFFVSDEDRWNSCRNCVEGHSAKFMKRIHCEEFAVEACATKRGTVVGPIFREIIGVPELTNNPGGWCGNEVARTLSIEKKIEIFKLTQAFGDEIFGMGYRGAFGLDFLIEKNTENIFFGECNPRLTGITNLTNLATQMSGSVPLILFHLLEWFDVDFQMDLEEVNALNLNSSVDVSQLIFKYVEEHSLEIVKSPKSGFFRKTDSPELVESLPNITKLVDGSGYFLRVAGNGDRVSTGSLLGRLTFTQPIFSRTSQFLDSSHEWVRLVKSSFGFK